MAAIAAGVEEIQLLAFLFGGGGFGLRGLGGLRLGQALLEFVHAAGGVDELLRAGVERMARVANTDDDHRFGRTRLDHIAARATNFRILIFGMCLSFHNKRAHRVTMAAGLTSRKLADSPKTPQKP